MNSAEFWLDYWEMLVPIYDTYGLPIDIIYCKLRDHDKFTILNVWPMDSETFAKNFKQAVQFRQCGGWRKVMQKMIDNYDYRRTIKTENEAASNNAVK